VEWVNWIREWGTSRDKPSLVRFDRCQQQLSSVPVTGEENSVHDQKERGRGRRRGWDKLSRFEDFPSMMGEKNTGVHVLFPLQ